MKFFGDEAENLNVESKSERQIKIDVGYAKIGASIAETIKPGNLNPIESILSLMLKF